MSSSVRGLLVLGDLVGGVRLAQVDADNASAIVAGWSVVAGRWSVRAGWSSVVVAAAIVTVDVLLFNKDLLDLVQQLRVNVLALVGLVATADRLVSTATTGSEVSTTARREAVRVTDGGKGAGREGWSSVRAGRR